jgi:molybdopterin-guanine dinucleotide biosynthesis protein A
MGGDKAVLDFCGTRMIDLVTKKLAGLTDRVVVVSRKRHELGSVVGMVIEDETPFAGPLPALIAGLRATGAERNIVVACDMPFLNLALVDHLIGRALDESIDAVVPVTAAGPEPLHAVYRDCALEPLLACAASGERSLRGALERLRIRWIEEAEWRPLDADGRSFLNVNTPEELQAAVAMQT